MGAARMHTVIVMDRTGKEQRRLVVAVREMLPGHLVYNPPITLQAGESLRFDPPLETVIGGRVPELLPDTTPAGDEE